MMIMMMAQQKVNLVVALLILLMTTMPPMTAGFLPGVPPRRVVVTTRRWAHLGDDDDDPRIMMEPTKKRQEQFEKYGPTPETSMELLFDSLLTMRECGGGGECQDGEDDGDNADFWTQQPQGAGDKWRDFLSNLKELKEQQHPQQAEHGDDEDYPGGQMT